MVIEKMLRFLKDYGLNHSSKSSINNIPNFVTKKEVLMNLGENSSIGVKQWDMNVRLGKHPCMGQSIS